MKKMKFVQGTFLETRSPNIMTWLSQLFPTFHGTPYGRWHLRGNVRVNIHENGESEYVVEPILVFFLTVSFINPKWIPGKLDSSLQRKSTIAWSPLPRLHLRKVPLLINITIRVTKLTDYKPLGGSFYSVYGMFLYASKYTVTISHAQNKAYGTLTRGRKPTVIFKMCFVQSLIINTDLQRDSFSAKILLTLIIYKNKLHQ